MADQSTPVRPQDAPDPARTYERAKPEAESGMGRLDNNKGTPTDAPDRIHKTAANRQKSDRQINAEDEPKDQHPSGGGRAGG